MNVLVVEDDEVARIKIQNTVREGGHSPTGCATAEEAVERCQRGLYSLIILDLNLPGMDGIAFAKWVRSQPWGDLVFILVATGCNAPEDLQRVLGAGADDYLAKPYETGMLRVRLAVAARHVAEIQKRHQAEATLRDSESRFALFMDNLPGVAFLKDLEGRYVFANEPLAKEFEARAGAYRGKTDFEIWPAETARMLRANDQEAISAKTAIQRFENLPGEGGVRHWFVHKFPILNADHKTILMGGLGIDVTDLRVFEELNRRILENATDGFLLVDSAGKIIEANRAFQRMTGHARGELLGRRIHDLADGAPEKTEENLRLIREEGGRIFEAAYKCRPGGTIDFEISSACLDLGGQRRYIAFFRDISERRKLAEERLKVTRLEGIGLLAGGIAHEFNNALTAVTGNISLAQSELAPDEPASALLFKALHGCQRTAGLTKQLLTFATGGEPVKQRLPLPKFLRETVMAACQDPRYRAGLQINDDLWAIEIDPEQFAQALRNVMQNAKEAMPSGGILRVRALNTVARENEISGLAAGRFVKISISDEGPGVAPEIASRIFDPYFTTKSGAAGLGLAICYSIVKRHNGVIGVEPARGRGATFNVYLPACAPTQVQSAAAPSPNGAIQNVLVMDDDPDVCDLISAILNRKGFKISVARDGAEAIRAYSDALRSGHPFHVVFMDLTVPGGLGGMEAQRELLKIDPQVKAIVCSGYSSDPVMANHTKYGFVGRLPKPFTSEELLRSIAGLQAAA